MKRIYRIDASSIKESACFRRFWLITGEHYRERGLANDIHYGSCFHKCVEVTEQTDDPIAGVFAAQELWREQENKLFVKPSRKYLSLAHLTMACQMYGQQRKTNSIFTDIEYLRNPAGQFLLEQKMSVPLYEDDTLLILLQGTLDGIARIKKGCIVIADWKTTGAYDIEDYFAGYTLSPQLKTYYYGLDYYRKHYPDSPLGRMLTNSQQIGAIIYGGFHSAGSIIKFERSKPFWFPQIVMQDYQHMLNLLVQQIKIQHECGGIPPAEGSFNGACVGHRGDKCKFFDACACETQQNGSATLVKHYLNSNFSKREYRPLEFGGGNKQKENKNEKDMVGSSLVS